MQAIHTHVYRYMSPRHPHTASDEDSLQAGHQSRTDGVKSYASVLAVKTEKSSRKGRRVPVKVSARIARHSRKGGTNQEEHPELFAVVRAGRMDESAFIPAWMRRGDVDGGRKKEKMRGRKH